MMWLPLATTALILVAGVIDDLRLRQVRNPLVVAGAVLAVAAALISGGLIGLGEGVLGLLTAAALTLPLFYLRVIGGGDAKLMMAVSLATGGVAVIQMLTFSLIWGAVLGLCMAITHGTIKDLFAGVFRVITRKEHQATLHRIPYTVALLLGFLTYLKYDGVI